MRQDVRLRNYYYRCSRVPSVLLIDRVAQVSSWCHHYDYCLTRASINIYIYIDPPCLILNLVYITSPQQPNDGRPHYFANYNQKWLLLLLSLWLFVWSWTTVRSHWGLHVGCVLAVTCASVVKAWLRQWSQWSSTTTSSNSSTWIRRPSTLTVFEKSSTGFFYNGIPTKAALMICACEVI